MLLFVVMALHISEGAAMASSCSSLLRDPRLLVDDSTDVNAAGEFNSVAAEMLVNEDFVGLDCLADQARTSKARFTGGMWKLHAVYAGLQSPATHATEKDWKNHLDRIERWLEKNPESVTARIALAESFLNYAWDARGEGASDTVSNNGWKLFTDRTKEARKILERVANPKIKCPEWYVAMMSVALAQGWKPEEASRLVDESVSMEPEYYYVYRLYATYLLPKWYGEDGQTEAFAASIADRLGPLQGDAVYFQIASSLACNCNDQPQLSRMSWDKIQKGYAALQQQHGISLLNANLLGYMAIKLNDAVVADRMFKRIGEQWDENTWHRRTYFDQSKKWASQTAPGMEAQEAIEMEADANHKGPGGDLYQGAFEGTFGAYVQKCVNAPSSDRDPFEMLVQVGEGGTVRKLMSFPSTAVSQCLFQTLLQAQMKSLAIFPPPPKADYWVKLHLDPSFTSTAPKVAKQ